MPKISELVAVSNVSSDDLLLVVNDPGGAPSTNKITVQNFTNHVVGMTRYANTTSAGVVKVGSGLEANSTGFISLTPDQFLPQANREEGYVLTWDQVTSSAIWQTFSGVYDFTVVNTSNTYNVAEHDGIIFADPNAVGKDIYVVLPDGGSNPPAVVGKTYTIKNVNPGDGYVVRVISYSGKTSNVSNIENPENGILVVSYDITKNGDAQQWVFDGFVWKHLGSQTNIPFFSAEANTYTQIVLQNRSSGNNASGDIVVYNDAGTPNEGTGPFVDLGINSSQYSNTIYSIGGPNDSYLFNDGGNFAIGTGYLTGNLIFHAGGTTSDTKKVVINSTTISLKNRVITLDDLDGPYASDAAANSAGIPIKGLYYDSSGNVKVRLT